jgi:hypothetical protein
MLGSTNKYFRLNLPVSFNVIYNVPSIESNIILSIFLVQKVYLIYTYNMICIYYVRNTELD